MTLPITEWSPLAMTQSIIEWSPLAMTPSIVQWTPLAMTQSIVVLAIVSSDFLAMEFVSVKRIPNRRVIELSVKIS